MNIKEYFDFEDTKFTEFQIYYWMKDTYIWNYLKFKVRVIEFIFTQFPRLYNIFEYPTDLINMVNKWEDK